MPIGKNSIKRVKDGYSNLASAAPDMENSTVLANPAPEVIELVSPKAEASAPKKRGRKPGTKNAPKAQSAAKKPAAKKTPVKKAAPAPKAEEKKDGFFRCALGDEMPTYLL